MRISLPLAPPAAISFLLVHQIVQIVKILNTHLSALAWLDQNAMQLQGSLEDVRRRLREAQIEADRRPRQYY